MLVVDVGNDRRIVLTPIPAGTHTTAAPVANAPPQVSDAASGHGYAKMSPTQPKPAVTTLPAGVPRKPAESAKPTYTSSGIIGVIPRAGGDSGGIAPNSRGLATAYGIARVAGPIDQLPKAGGITSASPTSVVDLGPPNVASYNPGLPDPGALSPHAHLHVTLSEIATTTGEVSAVSSALALVPGLEPLAVVAGAAGAVSTLAAFADETKHPANAKIIDLLVDASIAELGLSGSTLTAQKVRAGAAVVLAAYYDFLRQVHTGAVTRHGRTL